MRVSLGKTSRNKKQFISFVVCLFVRTQNTSLCISTLYFNTISMVYNRNNNIQCVCVYVHVAVLWESGRHKARDRNDTRGRSAAIQREKGAFSVRLPGLSLLETKTDTNLCSVGGGNEVCVDCNLNCFILQPHAHAHKTFKPSTRL